MGREQRRLAAIMAADVVGYSGLMSRDESGTLARLKAHRAERLEPALARNGGRLVKLTGDGALVEFSSAVDAITAAIEFQQATAEANSNEPQSTRIVFRVGLHLGDLIVDGDDLYGDGVNIATRLEAEAPAGGILISRAVREAVQGRLKANLHPLGDLTLKNIERPIRAFRVEWDKADWQVQTLVPAKSPRPEKPVPTLPDKPSIAVLPFQNMSGDPEQDYFADGIVDDIITALSRTKSLFVIASSSSFTYKGTLPDVRQVGRELGVRYVLEGSVRKAAVRVRITSQLIEAASAAHIWAERFEGNLENIFELQDRVTARVVSAIFPSLEQVEIQRSHRKPTEDLQAYDYYLRGMSCLYKSKEKNEEALGHFRKSISLDPEFARSFAEAAFCYAQRKGYGANGLRAQEAVEAERLARRALELDRSDPSVLALAGWTLVQTAGNLVDGAALLDLATELDPNLFYGWHYRGWTSSFLGEERAIEFHERALRLSPVDPKSFLARGGIAFAHFLAGRYDEASSWAGVALRQAPNHLISLIVVMASHALAGRTEEARAVGEVCRGAYPGICVSHVRDLIPLRLDVDLERFVKGFRLAGMPE